MQEPQGSSISIMTVASNLLIRATRFFASLCGRKPERKRQLTTGKKDLPMLEKRLRLNMTKSVGMLLICSSREAVELRGTEIERLFSSSRHSGHVALTDLCELTQKFLMTPLCEESRSFRNHNTLRHESASKCCIKALVTSISLRHTPSSKSYQA